MGIGERWLRANFGAELCDHHTFVICSDGLTIHVDDAEIRDRVRAGLSQEACDNLVALALERGGADNVTVVVARYRPDGAPQGQPEITPAAPSEERG
jgi:protein phosphatase